MQYMYTICKIGNNINIHNKQIKKKIKKTREEGGFDIKLNIKLKTN